MFNPFMDIFIQSIREHVFKNTPGISFNLPGASAANPSRNIYGFIFFFFYVAHFCLAGKGGGGE